VAQRVTAYRLYDPSVGHGRHRDADTQAHERSSAQRVVRRILDA
jgi:hypothetical protein